MTLRITTTAETGASDPWTPAADFVVQGQAVAGSSAVIAYQARLDPAAEWVEISAIRPASQGMMSCAKLGQARLVWSGNRPGNALQAWSVE